MGNDIDYGKMLETRIKHDAEYMGITCIKVPEIDQFIAKINKRVRRKTQFDFCLGIKGKSAFMDAKACGEDLFNFQSLVFRDKKIHQFQELLKAEQRGNPSGYLIWFYKKRRIGFAKASYILALKNRGIKSIGHEDIGIRWFSDDEPYNLEALIFG